ncbi:unnamed protein product [Mycena citricolor]|uniref:Methyltransferase type 11 domain-containing protein n=1 Tax=Mycena citricolor TaxID=2018698 RepID=A0AAD2K4B5_9AGAR|nr:unnamed protein product [Mycena citricolor]
MELAAAMAGPGYLILAVTSASKSPIWICAGYKSSLLSTEAGFARCLTRRWDFDFIPLITHLPLARTIMPTVTLTTPSSSEPAAYEETHVHRVYEQIAGHFSSTRYKPWPVIAAFLESLTPGSLGLDAGTGNGKYLPLGPRVFTIGLDRSRNLLQIARTAGGEQVVREVVQADVMDNVWRDGLFVRFHVSHVATKYNLVQDYAISIATIHHLASAERRSQSVQRLLRAVSENNGRVLIYVWATKQDELSKRTIPRDEQDVFVPWSLASSNGAGPQVLNRYYHMFAPGELRDLVEQAAGALGLVVGSPGSHRSKGLEIVQDGWERSNYFVEARRWQIV